MSLSLHIGEVVIPYAVRRSARARRKRIEATADGVQVVVPAGTPDDEVTAYVESRRRWVFDAVRQIAERQRARLTQRYASGAKLQYRGRWLMLDVQPGAVDAVRIACRSKFHVTVPAGLPADARPVAVAAAFDGWLRARALRAVARFARMHARCLGVELSGARLSESKHRWGSCGRDGVVRVHWRLVQAPTAALEYVVAHEVAHLVERHHGPAFWAALGRTLPDWPTRKAMLERWEETPRAV